MSGVEIWHNPRCSKSRETLEMLKQQGVEPKVVEYLSSPPSAERLTDVLEKLGMQPGQLLRKKEAIYGELGLEDTSDPDVLIRAMCQHPILIERPVVIVGDRAALGRPPEQVLELLP